LQTIDPDVLPTPFLYSKKFYDSSQGSLLDKAKKIESKLNDGDSTGALRLLTSNDSVAPNNKETLAALFEKHPSPFTEECLLRALYSFPKSSAGGLDSLRPQILNKANSCKNEKGQRCLKSVQLLIQVLLKGKVADTICPILYGASLTALKKKYGGIRPIAVGFTYRRIASNIVSMKLRKATEYLKPHQLGFGIRGGCEAGAHTARRYFSYPHQEVKVFLKIDFKNACEKM